jgi:Cu-processing system ATP-binding protein
VIRYEAFTKRFGEQRAVEDLSLAIDAGEAVALLGPNGSGKTTTLKAAAGLLRPTSGRVTICGRPAAEAPARCDISFLPQNVSFPDGLTGREALEFYGRLRKVADGRVDEVLRLASLNGSSGRPIHSYSGGMLQRLGLAVAVLPNAAVLLLDEPTAALDPDGLCAFYGLVDRRRAEGHTFLFTSHQLGDAERLADRFAILVAGRLAAFWTRAELSERLAERGHMRLRLDRRPAGLLARVRQVAPAALWAGEELVVPGPARYRPKILDAVRAEGVEVRGLSAEEGRLDALYRELVVEASA